MLQAFIFDMDGILFDSETVGMEMALKAAKEQGIDMAESVQYSLLGANQAACQARYDELYGDAMDSKLFHRRWGELMVTYNQEKGMPLLKGAVDALHGLKAKGIKLAVATSNHRTIATEYLTTAGLLPLFDEIITGDQVENSKPAPDIYLKAAKVLGVAPTQCAGVEDSLNGVKAVKGAGMKCIMIPDLIPFGEKYAPFVDTVLESLDELIPWLEQQ